MHKISSDDWFNNNNNPVQGDVTFSDVAAAFAPPPYEYTPPPAISVLDAKYKRHQSVIHAVALVAMVSLVLSLFLVLSLTAFLTGLMGLGVLLMLQTGAVGAINESVIPALGEMWGDSKLDVLLFTLIGHDDTADIVDTRLSRAAFDAAAPQREAQWTRDIIEAVEATTPRILGVTVGQFLAGSALDNSDDLRAHTAPLLGEIEVPEGVLVERFIPVPSPAPLHKAEVERLVRQEQVWLLRQLVRLSVLLYQSRVLLHNILPSPRKRRRGVRVRP